MGQGGAGLQLGPMQRAVHSRRTLGTHNCTQGGSCALPAQPSRLTLSALAVRPRQVRVASRTWPGLQEITSPVAGSQARPALGRLHSNAG